MKSLSVLLCVIGLAVLVFIAIPGSVCAMDKQNSIGVAVYGAVGPDASATAVSVEYERQLNPGLSLTARAVSGDYDWDDGDNEEDGEFQGVGVGIRFYISSTGDLEGFFIKLFDAGE